MSSDTETRIKNFARQLQLGENRKVHCPECADKRTNKNDRSLSVLNKGSYAVYKCHRCEPEFAGRVELTEKVNSTQRVNAEPYVKPVTPEPATPAQEAMGISWLLNERCLDFEQVKQYVDLNSAYFAQQRATLPAIEFIYKDEKGKRVYSKFRCLTEKLFTSGKSSPGGTDTLYLTEAIDYEKKYLVITEGELDALCMKVHALNSTSIPTGANIKWLQHNQNLLNKFKRIYIWLDADDKGNAVLEKLKQADARLTKGFVYLSGENLKALYPGCKDANDVLKWCKENAQPADEAFQRILRECFEPHVPTYVIQPKSLRKTLSRIRDGSYATRVGIGEPCLDRILSPVRGYAGIVTGIPGHGKSTFLTWYAYRLAEKYGWRTVFWSPENDPALLMADLVSMAAGRHIAGHAGSPMMNDLEIDRQLEFVQKYFRVIQDSEVGSDIDSILSQMFAAAATMGGAEFMVIDPLNFIKRPDVKDQLEAAKIIYSKIRRHATNNDCFVALVAHPRKMNEKEERKKTEDDATRTDDTPTRKYEIPGMYSISGSADLANMADTVLTVYRDGQQTLLFNNKVRRPFLGEIGSASMIYRPESGRFIVQGFGPSEDAYRMHDDSPF